MVLRRDDDLTVTPKGTPDARGAATRPPVPSLVPPATAPGAVNHFKNEVYRNWIAPQAAQFGFRGHVDFEFTVERNGSMSALRLLKSSGTTSLDRAAQNALSGSRWMPLPDDYAPPRVTMQVTFFYNEAPQGS